MRWRVAIGPRRVPWSEPSLIAAQPPQALRLGRAAFPARTRERPSRGTAGCDWAAPRSLFEPRLASDVTRRRCDWAAPRSLLERPCIELTPRDSCDRAAPRSLLERADGRRRAFLRLRLGRAAFPARTHSGPLARAWLRLGRAAFPARTF